MTRKLTIALFAIVGIALIAVGVISGRTHTLAGAVSSTSTPARATTTARPSPGTPPEATLAAPARSTTSTSSEPDDDSLLVPTADPTLPATTPNQQAAVKAAATFMTLFARPAAGTTTTAWWVKVKPLLSAQAAADYAGTDPANVPYTRVTGPAQLAPVGTDTAGGLVVFVAVPTDTGRYLVHLQPAGSGTWVVTRLTPPTP